MVDQEIKVLLVEDNPGDARLIKEMLKEAGGQAFVLEWVTSLGDALERLDRGEIDLVLLDLGLPDSQGLKTFIEAYAPAPDVPFVVLTGLDDETMALTAVRQGAQDYLVKGATDGKALLRAIRYATERKSAEKALEAERQKFFSVLNALPAFVHLTGEDFTIRFANRCFREIFGEPGDKPCYQFLAGKNEPCENCQQLKVLETKAPQQFEWIDPRGGRAYEISKYPFCGPEGQLVLTLGVDITERKQAEEKLRESEQNLRHLASQLLTAQERERERISLELHDELGQCLLVMKLQAKHIERGLGPTQDDVRKECRGMLKQLDQLVEEVRRLARDLSPTMVKDLGLSSALSRLVKEFSRRYGIQTAIDMAEGLDEFFPRETQIGIYRIFQESLTNIGKYAQASKLRIDIKREDSQVAILVADNGRGFNVDEVLGPDPTRRGLGLMAMEERARMMGGTLKIWSQEGEGTRIALNIPISDQKAGQGGN